MPTVSAQRSLQKSCNPSESRGDWSKSDLSAMMKPGTAITALFKSGAFPLTASQSPLRLVEAT